MENECRACGGSGVVRNYGMIAECDVTDCRACNGTGKDSSDMVRDWHENNDFDIVNDR